MYRKEAFLKLYEEDSYVFRNKGFFVEDLQLTVLLATIGEIRYLDEPTLAYSINEKSITGNKDFNKQFDFHFGALMLTRYLANKTGVSQQKLDEVYKKIIHFILMQAFHSGDKARMKKIKSLIEEWKVPLLMKTKLIFKLTSNSILWQMAKIIKGA